MELRSLKPPRGSRRPNRRAGRGEGSGLGTTAGRGHKGQKARANKGVKPAFEGGQMPLHRRLPKVGFFNPFRHAHTVINLEVLDRFPAGATVDLAALKEAGIVRKRFTGTVKVLGDGEMKKALTVKASAFSKKAAEQIAKAGGKAEVVK